jgi:excisionase family DNA binding protein
MSSLQQKDSPHSARDRRGQRITFFTVAEVAEQLNVCTRTVRRWIERKLLARHLFGTAVRVSEADLKAFIAQHREP